MTYTERMSAKPTLWLTACLLLVMAVAPLCAGTVLCAGERVADVAPVQHPAPTPAPAGHCGHPASAAPVAPAAPAAPAIPSGDCCGDGPTSPGAPSSMECCPGAGAVTLAPQPPERPDLPALGRVPLAGPGVLPEPGDLSPGSTPSAAGPPPPDGGFYTLHASFLI